MSGNRLLEMQDINKYYPMGEELSHVLKDVCLSIDEGEYLSVLGPSGSGKSTLMYCISTLKKPTEGSVVYNGTDITEIPDRAREKLRRTEFGFVFQKHYLVPYMSALDNVIVAAPAGSNAEEKAKEALRTLGLKEREFCKRPAKLSGGQCQRVAIARAMINDPKVVFADEPTASLDHENAFNVMRILKDYSKDRLVLVVTHDRSILTDVDMMVELWDGTVSNVTKGRA